QHTAGRGVCMVSGWLVVHDGQGPGPAGELAGDRDSSDGVPFAAALEALPTQMQPPIAFMATNPGRGGGQLPPVPHLSAGVMVAPAVMPGGLHQQPAGMAVAGLGDRTLGPGFLPKSPRWALGPRRR